MEKQTMRRLLTALALIIAAGPAAHAACKDEVASALERQRKTSGFRMQTKMLSEQGLVNMTVDYMLPDRMRQVVTSTTDPKPVETIVIGKDAWSRLEGEQWRPLHPQIADALAAQMQETLGDDPGTLGDFECLGKQPVADKNFLAYQGENVDPARRTSAQARPRSRSCPTVRCASSTSTRPRACPCAASLRAPTSSISRSSRRSTAIRPTSRSTRRKHRAHRSTRRPRRSKSSPS